MARFATKVTAWSRSTVSSLPNFQSHCFLHTCPKPEVGGSGSPDTGLQLTIGVVPFFKCCPLIGCWRVLLPVARAGCYMACLAVGPIGTTLLQRKWRRGEKSGSVCVALGLAVAAAAPTALHLPSVSIRETGCHTIELYSLITAGMGTVSSLLLLTPWRLVHATLVASPGTCSFAWTPCAATL